MGVALLLEHLELVPRPEHWIQRVQQALLIAAALYLTLKYLLLVICLLYLVNEYVYLGKWTFWHFIEITGHKLLRLLPFRFHQIDLRPIVGAVLIFLLAQFGLNGLEALYDRWVLSGLGK